MRRSAAALPLRLWLAVALAAIAGIPTLTTWGIAQVITLQQQQAGKAQIAQVRHVIGADVAQWRDTTWQQRAGAAFAAQGVEVRLVDAEGQQVYVTRGARQILNTYTAWSSPRAALAFQKIAITDTTLPAATRQTLAAGKRMFTQSRVLGTASLWFTRPPSGVPPSWLVPASGAMALLLTLAAVTWFLGRAVLRPLAAMSRAVEQIAGGDLDVSLPSSQAREVAEVAGALAALSAALREALDRQTALEEERRLFISAIAHDLRTPLFMLRGYLKGLETGIATTPEKMAHYVHACRTRADALERLIADLFAYTRLEYLGQATRQEPLELGALLGEAMEGAQALAAVKGIRLALHGPPTPCAVIGDNALLGRAVQNLLDNALRHTPTGGCIQIRWNQVERNVTFQVEDSGPGIAPQDLPHLFTPLYRGETSRNRQTGGAGLGLTIALRILQDHGGDLTAANRAGGGAVFTGTLPIERCASTSAAPGAAAP